MRDNDTQNHISTRIVFDTKTNVSPWNISKSHNSAKIHWIGTRLWYAQLGIVLINPTKFHEYPTKGYRETACTKFSMEIFQSPITPQKIIELEQDNDMHNYALYLSILQSFINIQPRVMEKPRVQIFNGNISNSHNSARNYRTGTR